MAEVVAEEVERVIGVDNVGRFIRVMTHDVWNNECETYFHPVDFTKLIVWGQQVMDRIALDSGD
jgi:hypothetical protein